MEKEPYTTAATDKYSNESPPYDDPSRVAKGGPIGEAADMYGDVATADEYGYVHRGCVKSDCLLEGIVIAHRSFQSQESSHPVHSAWRYHRHRSVFRNWKGSHKGWSS